MPNPIRVRIAVAVALLLTFGCSGHMRTVGEMMEQHEAEMNAGGGGVYQVHRVEVSWIGEKIGDEFETWRVVDDEIVRYRVTRLDSLGRDLPKPQPPAEVRGTVEEVE